MAATYEPIATATPNGVSNFTFSSIPSTYTDLIIVAQALNTGSNANVFGRPNSDSGTNYDRMVVYGTGTTAGGVRVSSNNAGLYFGDAAPSSGGYYAVNVVNINGYTNTSAYKSSLAKGGLFNDGAALTVSNWLSTTAISSIYIYVTAGAFASGTSFALYGIKAA
jgi:hypothetical protein